MELASVRALVYGRVTGIGFRAFVRARAQVLGVTGYVRNLPGEEAVEVEAEGDRRKLEQLVAYLRVGPPLARVEKVEVNWSAYTGSYPDFRIRQ